MFDTVLVANRGEIAVRIIRTLRRMGIRSIAVYSDADAGARHVRDADLAIRLGPALAAHSYLDLDRVIDAAVVARAGAIHPGYGFLSENPALAAACTAAGIVFVGPPIAAIEAMGDKIRAKRTVAANGVRVVPGVDGSGLDDAELAARAAEIGFPLLIKPSAGGGGKGMRRVDAGGELRGAIESARREARGSFGDDTLLVERYVERPRHIEVQVVADAFGNIVHLGERECSLQRRHQKVIEEAPSPLLDAAGRRRLGDQAVAAARSVGYVNAGTVEFIVSGSRPDDAYFLEMNTRLQVEHPVTELVCGLDLVELQLLVAAGSPLPFAQADVSWSGHAIEARVYAEDPDHDFLPTGGHVVALQEAESQPNVRVDSSLLAGGDIGSAYDPMLAKVIAWGPDREAARRTLDGALAATQIVGVTTNIAFLRSVLADPDVVGGSLDTGLVERIAARQSVESPPLAALVAAAVGAAHRAPVDDPWCERNGWRLGTPAWIEWAGASGGRPIELRYRLGPDGTLEVDGGDGIRSGRWLGRDGQVWVELDGLAQAWTVTRDNGTVWVAGSGAVWEIVEPSVRVAGAAGAGDGGLTIRSPMPGTVVAVQVAPGDTVVVGDPVLVVEAMKMEHTLRAAAAGQVVNVSVRVGDSVALGQVLASIEPADAA